MGYRFHDIIYSLDERKKFIKSITSDDYWRIHG